MKPMIILAVLALSSPAWAWTDGDFNDRWRQQWQQQQQQIDRQRALQQQQQMLWEMQRQTELLRQQQQQQRLRDGAWPYFWGWRP